MGLDAADSIESGCVLVFQVRQNPAKRQRRSYEYQDTEDHGG
jgi:hypothetical protein